MEVTPPKCLQKPLAVPRKLLMGPGPSNCPPRVLQSMANPLLGQLHTEFIEIMDEVKEGLRYVFQTKTQVVCCISGTGHAGMEAVMNNLLEKGDRVLIGNNGIWGERAADMARRIDADVRILAKAPGCAFSLQEIESGLQEHRPSVLFLVQGESSTGVLQPLEGVGELCHKYETLLAVDTVASLCGVPFYMDAWGVDVVYTGTQKVLSAPPSLAPIAFNEHAMAKVDSRKSPGVSFSQDIKWLANYWGCDDGPRRYHHTAPISSIYALREALAIISEEGLQNVSQRHQKCALQLHRGLAALGLNLFVDIEGHRLPTVTAIKVPQGVDWAQVNKFFMSRYLIEIGGGLGPTAGQIWRVGLMGYNCTSDNVELLLKVMKEALQEGAAGGCKL